MYRIIATTVLTAAMLGLGVGTASAASAADTPAVIEAVPQDVTLDQDPWVPTGDLAVVVRNHGPGTADGQFVLHLPNGVELAPGTGCRRADGPHQPAHICGGTPLKVGATATYRVKLRSTTGEPVFDVRVDDGWVEGKNPLGGHGTRRGFTVNWPAKLPVRLAATVGPRTGGHVDVDVRVTNAGRTALGGYSLNVTTPAGVRVLSPTCSDSGRMNGVGCELYRAGQVAPGGTDAFRVRLAVGDNARSVQLRLAPTNRYSGGDTQVTVKVGGKATASPAVSAAAAGTGGSGSELPLTGPGTGILLAVGAGLVLLGGALTVRRRGRPAAV